MTELLAWLAAPAVLLVAAAGVGLLVERAAGTVLASALLAPVGLGGAVLIALAVLLLGGRGVHAALAVGACSAGGLFAARRDLTRRLRPGWGCLAGAAAYALYMAPVLASGRWGWTGYQFVNDTSVHLILADRLHEAGVSKPEAPGPAASVWSSKVDRGYPLGSHGLLAALHAAVPVRMDALYQPLLALFAATGAAAGVAFGRALGLAAPFAAGAGFAAVAANLTYQFGLQGGMKEVAGVGCLLAAGAVAAGLLEAREPRPREWLAAAISAAAALAVLGVGAAAPVAILGVVVAVALWRALGRRALRTLVLLAGALTLLGLPAVLRVVAFADQNTFLHSPSGGGYGNLLEPLHPLQAAGIWLVADYRLEPPGLRGTVSVLLALALLGLALVALARWRTVALWALLAPLLGGALLVAPFATPYADAKLYALAGPALVLAAAAAVAPAHRRERALGAPLLAVLALGIAASDLLAYRAATVSPPDRLRALERVAEEQRGAGLILVNEPEEFAKWAMRDAQPNVGTEAAAVWFTELRSPRPFLSHHFNLDDQALGFVEFFPVIVQRGTPDSSRPPLSFRRANGHGPYEVWERRDSVEVRGHLPIGGVHSATGEPYCQDVTDLASEARRGDLLAVARGPEVFLIRPTDMERPSDWAMETDPHLPGSVTPGSAGTASGSLEVPRGEYAVWLQGSFGRGVEVEVDGQKVGTASGVDLPGLWTRVGSASLEDGVHAVALRRGRALLAPSSGYAGHIGPLAFERLGSRSVLHLPPREAKRLCGERHDWIELVRPARGDR